MRGATTSSYATASQLPFQSTLLMRGATFFTIAARLAAPEFQSTLLMRGATRVISRSSSLLSFQSTLLMRGATTARESYIGKYAFQSTLLMRGATFHMLRHDLASRIFQSTLLMRGATWAGQHPQIGTYNFNPRSSCEERLLLTVLVLLSEIKFQSTLLMRGATQVAVAPYDANQFQSTLLMRGATAFQQHRRKSDEFQSTLLMRGATRSSLIISSPLLISIHAPHARSDSPSSGLCSIHSYFNPRSSCEERLLPTVNYGRR